MTQDENLENAKTVHAYAVEVAGSHEEGSDEHADALLDVQVAETNLKRATYAHEAAAAAATGIAAVDEAEPDSDFDKLHALVATAEKHVGQAHSSILVGAANEIRAVVAELRALVERLRG